MPTAFVQQQAAQCGYCLQSMIIATVALLGREGRPDEATIRRAREKRDRLLVYPLLFRKRWRFFRRVYLNVCPVFHAQRSNFRLVNVA
jgi:hypothetical protein